MSEEQNEIVVPDVYVERIEVALLALNDSFADVGAAHLANKEAHAQYSVTVKKLKLAEEQAAAARRAHDVVMADVASSLSLPPGNWSYDKESRTLKKEVGDA